MDEMFHDLDRMDNEFWGRKNPLYGKNARNIMKTDVREHDYHYELDVDLPGFSKDEITLNLESGYLTISAAKSLDREGKEKKRGRVIRQERYAGSVSRSFYIGEELTQDEIKAAFKDGVLKITLPKREIQKKLPGGNIAIEG